MPLPLALRAQRVPGLIRGAVALTALSMMTGGCDGGGTAGEPAEPGPLDLAGSEVHVLGTSESMSRVYDLDVAEDGSVWALNDAEPFFIGFRPDGGVLAEHGSQGGGPEQFRMPTSFVTGGVDGQVWVLDFLRHSLMRVSEPQAPWMQVRVPRESVPTGSLRGGMDLTSPVVRTARLGHEIILPRTNRALEQGIFSFRMAILQADLVALDPSTGVVRDVVALGRVLDDPSEGFEATEGGFPLWYRLWTVCGDRIRVYDRVRNQLRAFDGSGKESTPVDLPPVPFTEVTARQFAGAIFHLREAEVTGGVGGRLSPADSSQLMNEIVQRTEGDGGQLAAYLPRYVDFRCSSDGTMWLHPLDPDHGGLAGGPAWLRITPDGVSREVLLPARFDALRFDADRIWGVARDELDVASVAWIALGPGVGR